ncbi:3-mercaptopyruvate sulfurtransferase [Arenicella xantha]|uniref:Thiosulfate/3-mercaptopyruvate sulfurtransferase n=1 Tax=Arenicella xantha TaxID=644221 RepID=A0A395JTE5_9GAMM|nr:3-mercaptopyruvate sulfurtransferase [Arenicella xantha]RBP52848.1 thiosulfate/3-mercaptopyruvate sulfurtransferase [Arenicella xantha]
MPNTSQLCSVDELSDRLNDPTLRVLDGSWYLPSAQRNTIAEYQQQHIPGAQFFDIDMVSDTQSELPHMLPSADIFSTHVGNLGISNRHEVVVYDTAGLFSAARVWWMFKVFGHQRVRVLNGGMPAWIAHGGAISAAQVQLQAEVYESSEPAGLVVNHADLLANCHTADYTVLDARSAARFAGRAPEPRAGLPSGHIPGSKSLPFDQLLLDGQLRSAAELGALFESLQDQPEPKFITSCGSGVTAAIISLALFEAGYGLQRLYDGAWAEWASLPESPIEVA